MEVVLEPNIVSDCIKGFIDDHEWPKHIKTLNRSKSIGEPLQIYNNT